MIYTINDVFPSRSGDFTLNAAVLGLISAIHTHPMSAVSGLTEALAAKAALNHTHVAMRSINTKSGAVTLTGAGAAGVTLAGQTIRVAATVATTLPTIAPCVVNAAGTAPFYTLVGTQAAILTARKGRGYSVAAATDIPMLTATTAKASRPIRRVFTYQDGTLAEVGRVLADTVQVYPPPAGYKLRIQSDLDASDGGRVDFGDQYPSPVMNVETSIIKITVTPYPENGGWYLASDDIALPDTAVHYGTQTLTIQLPALTAIGSTLFHIHARPSNWTAGMEQQTVKFWRVKYSKSTLDPFYHWPLNGSLDEAKRGLQGTWQRDGAVPPFDATTIIRGRSLGPAVDYADASVLNTGARYDNVPVDLAEGATISFFSWRSGNNLNGYVGFIDGTNLNAYDGNHFGINYSMGYPKGWLPTAMQLTYSGARPELNKWNHYALSMSKEITEGYTQAQLASKAYFRCRIYINGIIMQETILTTGRSNVTAGHLQSVGKNQFRIGSIKGAQASGWYVDEVKYFQRELSEGEIQSEAALAGYSFEGGGTGGGVTPTALPDKPRMREGKPADLAAVPITGTLKPFVIDNQTIAIAGYFHDFYQARLEAEYPATLKNMEQNYRNGLRPDYLQRFYYQFSVVELMADYEPRIIDRFDSDSHFKVNGAAVTWLGAWSNSTGLFVAKDVFDGTRKHQLKAADMVHFSYVRLAAPMVEGTTYAITDADGNSASFVYGTATPASSIKVNQVGWTPGAGKKLAYLGGWDGSAGKHVFAEPVVAKVINVATSATYPCTVTKRASDEDVTVQGNRYQMNGEIVYELDFSGLTAPGTYRVHVAGVGYSHPFDIGDNTVGRVWYTHMRGMYHQRSGIAKGAPHTKWPMPMAQGITWDATFLPNDGTYAGCVDDDGVPWAGKQFEMIKATINGTMYRDVHGGWWDAADWDRRDYHLHCVGDLVNAYLLFPQNFSDSQLDLPESGDGIPDILSEAIWGMDVWRRAQNADGGVGCWIEAISHPSTADAFEAQEHFCLAKPTAESSVRYAVQAARLAEALQKAGSDTAKARADLFLESAIRAFHRGVNHLARIEFNAKVNGIEKHYTYAEPDSMRRKYIAWAAVCLFKATGDSGYCRYVTENFDAYKDLLDDNCFVRTVMIDICDQAAYFPEEAAWMRNWIITKANLWMTRQESNAYRCINWSPGHGYQTFQAWGACHPGSRGNLFVLAWHLTGDVKYRNAAQMAMDWAMGCNAMGRTLTTGLGTVYPVRILSKIDEVNRLRNGIDDPVPGISPYTYTGSLGFATNFIYGMFFEARLSDANFAGVTMCTIPGRKRTTIPAVKDAMSAYLLPTVPLWRKTTSLQDYNVAQAEFTVNETISPNALLCGALLSPGWTPPADWKTKTPIASERDIPGFIYLP